MASSSFCWGCFSKLRLSAPRLLQPPSVLRIAPFHTTAPALALPMKKKPGSGRSEGPKFRESRSARINKKTKREKPRPPAVGERRAARQRIVLSNTNALEVPDMQELSIENMTNAELRGRIVGLPMALVDRLRGARAFKTTQGWSLFRRPGTLVREETLELGRLIGGIGNGESEMKGKTVKRIITGDKGTGKSVHLTQAMTLAMLNNWVTVTIPEAQDLTIAHTAYAPSTTEPGQYVQKDAVAALLQRMVTANGPVLAKLHISQDHPNLKAPFRPEMNLEQLAKLGIDDTAHAWSVFQALWSELTATKATADAEGLKPFASRPPILVTVDGLAHWMANSKYRTAEYEVIHAHDLALVNHFLSLLSSDRSSPTLPNGGLLLYSTSTSNTPNIYTFDILLKQLAARTSGIPADSPEFPTADPYRRPDSRVLALLDDAKDLTTQRLTGLGKKDSKGLLEYFALSGILREKVTEEFVSEKWTLSGMGIVGELEKLGKRVRVPPPIPMPAAN
ncbi:hypothetical protein RJZ56_006579 [Blastomyces dermatitidis]|uniref:Small ribosomal subunit protein mS29 n=3 Tax=Blastomyces TaxID=229219 RepID=A0A179V271_BLAGS|nr:mitochondrial ribosomal protein DAP3 [Blastomyces gilchristii SLH14081]XP_045278351.1 mitochondrial ribosomal protein DAP3 [Blastomyces dermatitidis ER-3]EEQ91897.1 mitochondrial ribosomal protein DAP3 [Blastomyces dermatitidis ER-3]EGE81209.1 mitochondrial ribosomal protein DAP3 [Blastomyces dermatitidis ATCC 18188]OAT12702.1 mitochondrial ribosomal protein DAP3 [Blastomyces gilchristii SLH14081]